ncbi:MAG TPA: response regulator [Chitinophagaceae bacterium]
MKMQVHKILIVDDDSDDSEFFTEVIHEINPGIEVKITDSKEGLFKELSRETPDLIFIDSLIQNESGIDGIKQLKADVKLSHIPVIMYTGSSDERNIATAMKEGAAAYITKPDTMDGIRQVLNKVLLRDWESDPKPQQLFINGSFRDYEPE